VVVSHWWGAAAEVLQEVLFTTSLERGTKYLINCGLVCTFYLSIPKISCRGGPLEKRIRNKGADRSFFFF
jgi:hypothetical protein